MAKGLFVDGSVIYRNMQIWRTQLCPFGEIMALVPQQSSVLDIGCGGGLFLGLLAASGRIREGTGIDTSLPAIAQAEVMRSSHPNGAQLAFDGETSIERNLASSSEISAFKSLLFCLSSPTSSCARASIWAANSFTRDSTLTFKSKRPARPERGVLHANWSV